MTTKIVARMLMLSIQKCWLLPRKKIEIPADIVGRQVKHKAFGLGKITAIEGISIAVQFDKVGLKKMEYEFCMEKKLLKFI